jgi:predicted Zn-dependent protease
MVRGVIWGIVLVAVAWVGFRWKGRELYRNWRETRLVKNSEALLREGRLADAAVTAKRLLEKNPENPRGVRIMCEVAEKIGSREALLWRARLVEVDPGKTDNVLLWAVAALRFNEPEAARTALDRVPAGERDTVMYHELSAAAAFAAGDLQGAEHHFMRALESAPNDENKKLNLAKVLVQSTDPDQRSRIRQTIESVSPTSTNYPVALNLLVTEASGNGDTARAVQLARQLQSLTNASFRDRILCVSLFEHSDRPAFTNLLERLKTEALPDPERINQLIGWMIIDGLANQGLAWVRSQPPENFRAASAGMAVADLYASMNDWLGLRAWVRSASWGALDCFRPAFEAYAVHSLPHDANTKGLVVGLWQKAIDGAAGNHVLLGLLAQAAIKWDMSPQAEATWWAMADAKSGQEKALMVLYRRYLVTEDTLGQYRVARRLLQLNAKNLPAKNNAVYLGLLLKLDAPDLFRLAEELYQQNPNDASVLSTYAFALHRQKRTREALDKLSLIPIRDLSQPSIALMQGYLLASSGDREAAKPHLKIAEGSHLLPEEMKLLEEAKALARMQ